MERSGAIRGVLQEALVYCGVGGRSAKAMARMHELGFKEVYNMLGGTTEWVAQGYALKQ